MANSTDNISAFAFETGKQIEDLIDIRTNFLRKRNEELEAKILHYASLIREKYGSSQILNDYDTYFGIKRVTKGTIDKKE